MMTIDPAERLIVAVDTPSLEQAVELAESLEGIAKWLKIGSQLFTTEGPVTVRLFKDKGFKVFLDLKFHDIPATVANSAIAAVEAGADMFNVHASGGSEMMKQAREAAMEQAQSLGVEAPMMIAVTVLTSMDENDLGELGINRSPMEQVLKLASIAKVAGMDGVVASPNETSMIKETLGEEFNVITPGIRPQWASLDDQKRVMTPKKAIEGGSDYLVVGRPITKAENPGDAARRTLEEMTG